MADLTVEDEQWVESALKEYERKRCLSRVLSTNSERAVPKGNNFSSELSRLRMKVVLNSGEVEERAVIYKAMPKNRHMKAALKAIGFFLRESRMLNEILPVLRSLEEPVDPGCEQLWPECYGVKRGNEAYILEDLVARGFKMADRQKGLDFTHAKLIVECLARYHALAAVASDTGDVERSDVETAFYSSPATEVCDRIIDAQYKQFADIMEHKWQGEWVNYAERLRAFKSVHRQKVREIFKIDDSKFNTIIHGDCWLNNVMFKYDSEGSPRSLKFIDFQISCWNRPGIDLNYLFLTSLDLETMNRRAELLTLYYESLVDSLKLFGYQPPSPSFEDILEGYETSATFGYGMALAFRPMMMIPSDMSMDADEIARSLGQQKGFSRFDYEGEVFLQTMRFILKEAGEKGIL